MRKILHLWCEIAPTPDDETSPLIARLVRLITRLAVINRDLIIKENLCAFLVPHFETLCLTSSLADDLVSLLITLCATTAGKRHLRRLGLVQHILPATTHASALWYPLSLLLTQRDLSVSPLFTKLVESLIQRTVHLLHSLSIVVDPIKSSATTQTRTVATDWLVLLRTNFLSLSRIANEFIVHKKKVNFINMLLDTLVPVQQEQDPSLSSLNEAIIELLWTLSFSLLTISSECLQKRLELCQWLTTYADVSTPTITLASHAMLSILDSSNKMFSNTFPFSTKANFTDHFAV